MTKIKNFLVYILILIVATGLVGCGNINAGTQDFNQDLLMATREEIRSSNIFIETFLYNNGFFGPVLSNQKSLGSGVVFDEDETNYYALTNWHVIDYSNHVMAKYEVTDIHGQKAEGEVINSSQELDLAIIKFSKKTNPINCIDYTQRLQNKLIMGEFLLAVGNPSGVQNIVTFGEYLGKKNIQNVTYDVINHSVLIYPGNSGGALCDIDGNLVGINTWGNKENDEDNFAIPLEIINDFIEQSNIKEPIPDTPPNE